jgi:ribonuclease P protein component
MLPQKFRLTKNGSFNYLYAHGLRAGDRRVKLNFIKSKSTVRIGFSVSNKIGKAVVRNKVKRRMRAIIRELLPSIRPCQAVFIASVGIHELSFSELKAQLVACLTKAGLMK